jgi:pimeloyl-ACP methyl ester carboxylesterase
MKMSELSVQHHYVSLNEAHFHYVEAGQGPLVVLLHGFPEMWWSWRHQIQALADAGYRVIAPDLRGYNDSEKRGPYDLDTLAEDVRALIEHAGEKQAIIVGHDWGGAITWHFAAVFPEYCRKIAVLNCPHPKMLLAALRSNPKQIRKSWYIFAFQIPFLPEFALTRAQGAMIRSMYRKGVVDPTNFGEEEIAPMIEAIRKPGAAAAAVNYYRSSVREGLLHPKRSKGIRKIQAPTCLIWAKDDFALDYEALVPGTEKLVPLLQLKTIDQCGHFVHEEQPHKVNELLLGFFGQKSSGK